MGGIILEKLFTKENIMKVVDFIRNLFGRKKRQEENKDEVDQAFETGDFTDINNRLNQ